VARPVPQHDEFISLMRMTLETRTDVDLAKVRAILRTEDLASTPSLRAALVMPSGDLNHILVAAVLEVLNHSEPSRSSRDLLDTGEIRLLGKYAHEEREHGSWGRESAFLDDSIGRDDA
jgi:hypothetical protein